jgi:hypothetical protein
VKPETFAPDAAAGSWARPRGTAYAAKAPAVVLLKRGRRTDAACSPRAVGRTLALKRGKKGHGALD